MWLDRSNSSSSDTVSPVFPVGRKGVGRESRNPCRIVPAPAARVTVTGSDSRQLQQLTDQKLENELFAPPAPSRSPELESLQLLATALIQQLQMGGVLAGGDTASTIFVSAWMSLPDWCNDA